MTVRPPFCDVRFIALQPIFGTLVMENQSLPLLVSPAVAAIT